MAQAQQVVRYVFLGLIVIYQKMISPFLGSRCRFYPSCSNYAKESFKYHGVLKALWLTTKRLLKCHPLHPGGYDPVPDTHKVEQHHESKKY